MFRRTIPEDTRNGSTFVFRQVNIVLPGPDMIAQHSVVQCGVFEAESMYRADVLLQGLAVTL